MRANHVSFFVLSLMLAAGLSLPAAQAAGTYVNLPGLNIETGDGGTSVTMPGLDIQTGGSDYDDEAQTTIVAPGAYVQTRQSATGGGRSFVNADLIGMDFRGQDLTRADFSNATLTNTDFSGAILVGATFTNADLTNTNFSNAVMIGADMSNTTLIRTNLTNADLSQVNLTNATIEGALATGTRFEGANLSNVDMSMFVRHATAPRPVFVDARSISQALTIDPARPTVPKRIDLTVNFDFNSDKLTADGMKQVNEIATALSDPNLQKMNIIVEGHTDNVGTDDYNLKLSYRRALHVLGVLVKEFGISDGNLKAKGYGETLPIASNDNDLGRAMNRRVTLVNMGQ